MKTFKTLAIITLGLISLMDIGYPFTTNPEPAAAGAVAVFVLGLAGLAACLGLARNTAWSVPAALVVAGANVGAAAGIALVADAEGAVTGLVVSSLALLLSLAATSGRRTTSPA